jgi:wyosine [tRNA(Phe)-imidazoG37] synthetase (radical SAM superfamily)
MSGIGNFAMVFANHLWLELFLLDGITALSKNVKSMNKLIDEINPEKVQINTATRPAAEDFAFPVSHEKLVSFAGVLGPRAEVVTGHTPDQPKRNDAGSDTEQTILALLRRRPCTGNDVADALALHRIEAVKVLDALVQKGEIESERKNGKNYFMIRK